MGTLEEGEKAETECEQSETNLTFEEEDTECGPSDREPIYLDGTKPDGEVFHDNYDANTVTVYRSSSSAVFDLSPVMLGGYPYHFIFWIVVLCAAGACITFLTVYRRQKNLGNHS